MIISNHSVKNVAKLYLAPNSPEVNKKKSAEGFKPTGGADKITLSDDFWAYRVAREALAQVPEVRAEKVAELKKQIKEGTYQVDSAKLAEKIIQEHILDTLV